MTKINKNLIKKMKLLKLTLGILTLTIWTSCVTLPINQQFYNTQKVGIILKVENIGMTSAGTQGLQDIPLTAENKFTEPLMKIEPKLNLKETCKTEITNILKSKNKQFEFITENNNYDDLNTFEKPNSDKKFSKKDFRKFKISNNVAEILYVKVKYGLYKNSSGLITLDKRGYVYIETQIVDLSDNSLLQQDLFETFAEITGNWKEGQDYGNLQKSIQEAINNSLITLKTKF